MSALRVWTVDGLPLKPSAWVFRVAHNKLMSELRQRSHRQRLLEREATGDIESVAFSTEPAFDQEVHDDLLRMLFVCCDDRIPEPAQLVLALKILCGFDITEISHRLFATEATIYKRLSRAREQLRQLPLTTDSPAAEQYATRLPSVRKVLYLLFTEGHLSSRATIAIRRELCDDAIRLTTLLAEHRIGDSPESAALLALMHFHAARINARHNHSGGLLLLDEQDRSEWDQAHIQSGLIWLARSARGDSFSRYHCEAVIAAEHCLAPSFRETRWDKVVEAYALLERTTPSPLHRLNRAVAMAEWQGPAAGLAILDDAAPPTWLEGYYLWAAVRADLHRRSGHVDLAAQFRSAALDGAPSDIVRELLRRRLLQAD